MLRQVPTTQSTWGASGVACSKEANGAVSPFVQFRAGCWEMRELSEKSHGKGWERNERWDGGKSIWGVTESNSLFECFVCWAVSHSFPLVPCISTLYLLSFFVRLFDSLDVCYHAVPVKACHKPLSALWVDTHTNTHTEREREILECVCVSYWGPKLILVILVISGQIPLIKTCCLLAVCSLVPFSSVCLVAQKGYY